MPKLAFSVAGDEVVLLEFQAMAWQRWRARFPSRRRATPNQSWSPPVVFTQHGRPRRADQRPWHVYQSHASSGGTITQQWVMVPTLLPASPEPTQPLVGAPEEAKIFTCIYKENVHQHWSNLHRVLFLAQQHPLVDEVTLHKTDKGKDPIPVQRARALHQIPPGPLRFGNRARSLWRGHARWLHSQ